MEKYLKRKSNEQLEDIKDITDSKTSKKIKTQNKLDENNCVSEKTNNTNNKWIRKETVLICDFGSTPADKILALDMDFTLIAVKSKNKFPINHDDWVFLFDKNLMIDKINKYFKEGFKIVIFTNQKGISNGKSKESDITLKIENIQKSLGIPLMAFIATEDDYYRKPSIGLWKLLFEEFNQEIKKPCLKDCLFIGDAAGRKVNKFGKKDHSNADYLFSLNVNIDFKTPEAFFENAKNDYGKIDFNPKILKLNQENFDLHNVLEKLSGKKDIIIFCGSAGSGKTNLYHNHLKKIGYEHVNQDQLKTEHKCVKVATELLSQGKGVCIDSTNPSKAKRKVFVDLAKKMNVTIRCFYFKMEKDLVFHLNNLRSINKFRTNYSKGVADVIIHTWYKNLEEPKINEGFDKVCQINFFPGPFENEQDEELFYCYS